MSDRRIDAFFYGLFMDVDILKQSGVESPAPDERNPEYATRLQRVLEKLNFPREYFASVC